MYRLYHAVEVYTGMYKTAETGLETRARSARVSKVSKGLTHSRISLSLSKVRIFAHFLKQRETGDIWNI